MSLIRRMDNDNQGRSWEKVRASQEYIFWVMVVGGLLLVVSMATSCLPNRKFAKAVRTMDSDPEQAAWYCAIKFPVKDTIIYRDSVTYDTIINENYIHDTATIHDTTTITNTSPAKTLVKTVYKVKEIVRENTAKVQALEYALSDATKLIAKKDAQVDECQKESNEWKGLAKKRFWWLLLIIAAVVGWVLRKPLMKIIKPI
jgi:hypothetical protein